MNGSIIDSVGNFNFHTIVLYRFIQYTYACINVPIQSGIVILIIYQAIFREPQSIGVINSLKSTFPLNILISLYNTLVLLHFNYCLLVWGVKTGSLLIFSRKDCTTVRTLTNSSYFAHTDVFFKQLNLKQMTYTN